MAEIWAGTCTPGRSPGAVQGHYNSLQRGASPGSLRTSAEVLDYKKNFVSSHQKVTGLFLETWSFFIFV